MPMGFHPWLLTAAPPGRRPGRPLIPSRLLSSPRVREPLAVPEASPRRAGFAPAAPAPRTAARNPNRQRRPAPIRDVEVNGGGRLRPAERALGGGAGQLGAVALPAH